VSGENLQVAIKYAQRGFAVFPLVTRTKEPATAHGCKDATRDPAIITRRWWSRASRGVAIRTGQASRLIVLDIDPRHGGDESLADLEQKYGPLPSAPTVHTGSDGKHYYLAYPLENLAYPPGAGEISCRVGLGGFSGVDLKADGGYVVAPPSIHPNGNRYHWDVVHDLDSTAIPPVPAWILELAEQGRDVERVPYKLEPVSEESELRIANAIGLYEATYRRFHERSRHGLRGAAAGVTESEVDYSLACALALAGLTGAEIEHAMRTSRELAKLQPKRPSYYAATIGKALGFAAGCRAA